MGSPDHFEKNDFLFLQPSNKSPGLHADLTNLGHMHSTELINADREKMLCTPWVRPE